MVEQVFVMGFVNGKFPYSVEVWHLSILEKSLALRKVLVCVLILGQATATL